MSTKPIANECELLVVGSGAAGLATSIAAAKHGVRPIIIEKARWFGGSTALSGGAIWCPANHLMTAAGMEDDLAGARRYLQTECGDRFNAELIDSYLENGPEAIQFFHEKTALQLSHRPYSPDYHPEQDGAALGGRVLDPLEYDGRRLGAELKRLRPPIPEFTILGGLQLGRMDLYHFTRLLHQPKSMWWAIKEVAAYYKDRLRYGRYTKIKMGAAVAARLAETAFELDIPIYTEHELLELKLEGQRVVAAKVKTPTGDHWVQCSKGVVLAAGGYPQDLLRREQTVPHYRAGMPHFSMAPASATGGAINAAEAIGAQFLSTNSNAASWTPVSLIPQKDGTKRPFPHLFMDRAKPGVIAVGHDGQRFTNEALSYHDFIQNMVAKLQAEGQQSAWLVCDHRAIRRYGLGAVPCAPGRIAPFIRSGYLKTGASAEQLAQKIGVETVQFKQTLSQYNAEAKLGQDSAFGKGSTPYQTALGDPEQMPNACLRPLEGRLYAVEIYPGDIGTTMGLDITSHGQVRATSGEVIPGLYAVGNDANSLMAGSYPGAGITLGPALTFGYLVGQHVANN